MIDWSDHEDDIADAISDSMDMDWTSRDGARAVVRYLAALPQPSQPSGEDVELLAEWRTRVTLAKAGGADVIKIDLADAEAVLAALSTQPSPTQESDNG